MLIVYADGALLHHSNLNDRYNSIYDKHLKTELNKAGSFEFTISSAHRMYDSIERFKTKIQVWLNDTLLFDGRVLEINETISKERKVYCEGNLAYLLDSLSSPYTGSMTVGEYLQKRIQEHNAQVEAAKQFTIRAVDPDLNNKTVDVDEKNYQDTRSDLESNVLNIHRGFLRTENQNGVLYLDYIKEDLVVGDQPLLFGFNLTDYAKNTPSTDVYSVMLPTGDDGLTVETVNNGSKYIENQELINKFGRVYHNQEFSGISSASELLSEATAYFNQVAEAIMTPTFSVKLADVSNWMDNYSPPITGKKYKLSGPDGDLYVYQAYSIDYDFDEIGNTTIEFTSPDTAYISTHRRGTSVGKSGSGSGSGVSKRSGSGGNASGINLKYYHEGNDSAKIIASDIGLESSSTHIAVKDKLSIIATESDYADFIENGGVGSILEVDPQGFRSISGVLKSAFGKFKGADGTAILQNMEAITHFAGEFTVDDEGVVKLKDGASFMVKKDGVYSLVGTENEIASNISQTKSEIQAEIHTSSSQIYSSLQMTASNIRSEIADTEQGLITYVNQTASGIFTRMESGTNRTKIQETDPTLDEGYTPKEGDFWVESVHDGTWDGADGYDWDREEPYDWSQLMGARVKVWKNGKWQVVTDRQQMVSYRDVVDTAQVYLDRRISEIVNDEGLLDVYMAKLERTATDLRSEISHATSDFYSEIHQSSSNVTVWVANRPTSIIQDRIKSGKPTTMTIGNLTRAPIAGDLWIDSANQDTWDKALNGDHKWDDDAPYSWNELRSDKLYKYDGTDWAEIMDGSQLLYEDTYTEQDERHRAEIARKIEKVDGEWRDNYSRIEQRADMIYSTVQDRTANLSSRIEQTADRVSSAVGDITRIDGKISEVEGSAIWQRRDSITQVVGKFSVDNNGNIVLQSGASFKITKNGVQSDVVAQTQVDVINGTLTTHNTRITQNANEIATKASSTTVNAIDKTVSNHTTQIKQNADAIALRATQTDLNAATGRISTVESTLSVQADQISSKVSKDGVISSINQTSESVTINAAKINLSGYVTASQMETAFATARSIKYLVASGTTITNSGGIYSKNIYLTSSLGDIELGNAVGSIGPASVDGGKITIPWTTLRGASGTAVTFNMADTAWYKGQVSAIKNAVTLSSPGWVDGKNVVSNSANSKTYTVNLPAFQTSGGTSWSNHKTTVTFSTQSVQTPLKSVTVDATSEYNSGRSSGYNDGYDAGYDAGWNACIDSAIGTTALVGYYEWDYRNTTFLYYTNDGIAYPRATGKAQKWVYAGSVTTLYQLPDRK